MDTRTLVVKVGRNGLLKLPPDLLSHLGGATELGVVKIGTSLVLAPVPEGWTSPMGRSLHYEGGRILRDPGVMFGTPVIAGTRVPARTVSALLKSGHSYDQVREEFPGLTDEQIESAAKFHRKPSKGHGTK